MPASALIGLLLFAPMKPDLVDLKRHLPTAVFDIRYATKNNFTKERLYPAPECYLLRPAADALRLVAADLAKEGLRLKIWDGYRPLAVTKKMWDIVGDERYVANPAKGSRHNRGMAVDLTLIGRDGKELPMPTAYDDFSERAHRDSNMATAEQRRNSDLLERVMLKHGFLPFETEWWHYDFRGWEKEPVLDIPILELRKLGSRPKGE